MKKILFIATAAAMIAGCAKVTTVNTEEPQEIAFKAYTNVSTKAPITDANFPEEWSMQVHAIYDGVTTGKDYFGGGVVFAKDGTYWSAGEDPEYWPITGNLTFNAIAPVATTDQSAAVVRPTNTNSSFFTYSDGENNVTSVVAVMDDNSSLQTDVLVARTVTANKQVAAVPMTFDHALAQVAVKAKVNNADINVTVTSVVLKNSYQNGTVTADPDAESKVSFAWITGDRKDVTIYTDNTGTTLTTTENVIGTGALVVPANLTEASENGAYEYLELKYDVTNGPDFNMKDVTAQIPLYIGEHTSWVAGTKYTYTLTFTGLQEILINPEVETWTETGPITVPSF